MSRGKSFSCSAESISLLCFIQLVVVVMLLLHNYHQTCDAIKDDPNCPPSSCGKIRNIKHPFRLKDDPTTCGDPSYELSCENNITMLTLFSGKYYVQEINYIKYTIRIVDSGLEEGDCSSFPRYFLTSYSNFSDNYYSSYINFDGDPYGFDDMVDDRLKHIIYLKCSKPVKDDPEYVDTAPCINSDSKTYLYAFATEYDYYFTVGRLKDYCQVKLVAMTSSNFLNVSVRDGVPDRSLSYEEIHGMLLYGFEVSWIRGACGKSCRDDRRCGYDKRLLPQCYELNDYCLTPLAIEIDKRCDQLSKRRILVEDIILGIVKENRVKAAFVVANISNYLTLTTLGRFPSNEEKQDRCVVEVL